MGNDVVDLKAGGAAGKSGDSRFVSRVLTSGEQTVLGRVENSDSCFWAMWAAKEAAYKAVSRAKPAISSSPRRYEVCFDNQHRKSVWTGSVATPMGRVYVQSQLDENYIHCIGQTGCGPAGRQIIFRVFETVPGAPEGTEADPGQQSAAVRRAAAAAIVSCLDLSEDNVLIVRDSSAGRPGPPVVRIKGSATEIQISLSHHGRFGAFALNIDSSSFFAKRSLDYSFIFA